MANQLSVYQAKIENLFKGALVKKSTVLLVSRERTGQVLQRKGRLIIFARKRGKSK